ncbi:MAG TPA: phosphoribosylaminoimidazolesuccinocarboxamide synthase, partial [Acidimicrobiia bacterium]|nr:phosphoribosylaminoimidazolesuccinocarboxamide synthase [Acidimicrobiia bacterium]
DVYKDGDDRLLMVASDRISAFDVVLPQPIPDKGRVLTAVSTFWFDQTKDIVPNHLISVDPADFPEGAGPDVAGRTMLVKAAKPVLMECVVRGYLFGSAWSEYKKHGTVNGEPLPSGMVNAERLPEPTFTPSTKADEGHDMALTRDDAIALVGKDLYERLRDLSIAVYKFGTTVASTRGILLADTKFEFGTVDGELVLIDEILTPDSSRFWPADEYEPGTAPPSFDKQYVRQYLLDQGWDGTPPPPSLPDKVVEGTRSRYIEAYELLTEKSFDDWYGVGG